MNLPSAEQYLEIVEKKAFGNLASLNHHRFIVNQSTGSYLFYRSPKAIVLKSEHREKFYAIRFFLKDDPELFGRYVQTQAYLKDKALPWKLPFEFLDKEFYPALKMEWIDSLSLAGYLNQFSANAGRLSRLQADLVNLSRNLEENKTGHGNLNLQHIRFIREEDYSIRLIDYDSMYIPAFERKHSLSAGTAGFQHPRRLASDFSPTVDRFTIWLLLTALEAVKTDPSLWKQTDGDSSSTPPNILFTYRDLASPEQSASFQLLKSYSNPALQFYTDKLISFCKLTSLSKIEAPELFKGSSIREAAANHQPPKATVIEKPKLREEPTPELRKPVVVEQPKKPVQENPLKKPQPVSMQVKQRPSAITQKNAAAKSIPVMTIEKPAPRQPQAVAPKKTRAKSRPLLISAFVVVILVAAYMLWPKQATVQAEQGLEPAITNENPVTATAPAQQQKQTVVAPAKKQTVFTSANLTQFLFQLYHAYNKRDLSSILSNYGDKVQYYDAGSVSKHELNGILDDLFIKPAYYECQPDLRTLSFQQQDDGCTINITVKETIKPKARSKAEKYTSTLEYRLDKDFHIISEKRVS